MQSRQGYRLLWPSAAASLLEPARILRRLGVGATGRAAVWMVVVVLGVASATWAEVVLMVVVVLGVASASWAEVRMVVVVLGWPVGSEPAVALGASGDEEY